VDVGQNTTLGDGDMTEQLVQFLIVTDGELQVTRDDTGLLVVTSGVSSQLQDFGSQVLEDGSQVNGSTCDRISDSVCLGSLETSWILTSTDTLGVVTLAEQTVNTTDGEGETSLGRTAANQVSVYIRNQRVELRSRWETYDCAFLLPLALPPDFPPVILLV
jgi:hypothetical protein